MPQLHRGPHRDLPVPQATGQDEDRRPLDQGQEGGCAQDRDVSRPHCLGRLVCGHVLLDARLQPNLEVHCESPLATLSVVRMT